MANPLLAPLLRWFGRLSYPRLFLLAAGLFVADVVIPDFIPFADELLLGLKQQRGTTLVVVTHNIPSARRIGDTLAFLHEGRILEHGTPEQLENSRQELVQRFMSVQGGT